MKYQYSAIDLLKAFYDIKKYEEFGSFYDYEIKEILKSANNTIDFLNKICSSNLYSKKYSDLYMMGQIISELIIRCERTIEKISNLDNSVEFIHECYDLEKIVVKSDDLKIVVNKIVGYFDKCIEVEFKL